MGARHEGRLPRAQPGLPARRDHAPGHRHDRRPVPAQGSRPTPLHAEYYIGGMTDAEQAHVAEVMPNMDARLFAAKDAARPDGAASARASAEPGRAVARHDELAVWRTREIASGNGHGNARGVARIYGALGSRGGIDGVTLMCRRTHRGDDHRAAQPDRAAAGPAVSSGAGRAAEHARSRLHGTEHAELRPSRHRRLDRLLRPRRAASASRTLQQDARGRHQRPARGAADRRALRCEI